jgi:DNA-binding IscR family transcriptional regulator
MGRMDEARRQLRERIEQARPGEHVASVASLSEAAGGLSTAATVGVLQEAIADGWITSTRGPAGGYWRTEKPLPSGSLVEALAALADHLQATLQSIQVVQAAISRTGRAASV